MELNPLCGAIQSLGHSLQLVQAGPRITNGSRFALLSLVQGVDGLLRDKLAKEHPALLRQQVDLPTESASYATVLHRLELLARYPFTEQHLPRLRGLDNLRSRLLQFRWNVTDAQVALLIADTVPFLDICLEQKFRSAIVTVFDDDTLGLTLDQVVAAACTERERSDREIAPILREARRSGAWPRRCPCCLEDYLVATLGDQAHCIYCGHNSAVIECVRCGHPAPDEETDHLSGRCENCLRAAPAAAFER